MLLKQTIHISLALATSTAPVFAADLDMQTLRDFANQDNAKALVKLEPLVKGDDAENAEAQFYYGRCLFNLKRYSAAKVPLEKSLSLGLEGWCEDVAKSDLVIINAGPSGSKSSTNRGGLRGYLGIQLNKNVVQSVVPNSPAEQARILPGDTILTVNRVSVVSMTPKDIIARLSGVVGSTTDLTIMRAGKTYSSRVAHAYISQGDDSSPVFEKSSSESNPSDTSMQKAPGAVKTASASSNISASDQALVKVFRHTSETDAIKAHVLAAVSHIPQNIKDNFATAGVTILITPTILDARPDLANQKPRGYDNGGGYDNCGGMYMPSEKTIYVAEKEGIQSQPFKFNRRAYETTLHEGGHAFDHLNYDKTKSDISKTEEFLAIYKKESDSLSNSSRSGVTYFLQPDGAGSAELCAELFVAICDPGAKDPYGVVKAFPRTYDYLKKIIQSQ
ncbi:MAG: PDZ domain-containing protein [Candidatus Obscuribacterales bacterium]|nr:PDZ domain-containing protein [Candidatus Obscuribacterales bacterium]